MRRLHPPPNLGPGLRQCPFYFALILNTYSGTLVHRCGEPMRTLCREEELRAFGIIADCPAPTLLVHCTPKVSMHLDLTLSSTLTITPNLGMMKAGNGDRGTLITLTSSLFCLCCPCGEINDNNSSPLQNSTYMVKHAIWRCFQYLVHLYSFLVLAVCICIFHGFNGLCIYYVCCPRFIIVNDDSTPTN